MVDTSSDTGCLIIIICNYDQYQAAKDQTGTAVGTASDTPVIRGRYTDGTNEKEGFYLMHRGWMDNPSSRAGHDPFCRRAAWVWLIEEAAWADRRVSLGGKTVTLHRGQLTHSVRFMAQAWNWKSPLSSDSSPGLKPRQ